LALAVNIVDLNSDGRGEVVVQTTQEYSSVSRSSETSLLSHVFDATGAAQDVGLSLPGRLFTQVWADMNGDGIVDLAGLGGTSFSGTYSGGSIFNVRYVGIQWNTEANKPPVITGKVTQTFTSTGPDGLARFEVIAGDVDSLRGGSVASARFWADTNNNGEFDDTDRLIGTDADSADGWAIQIRPRQGWAVNERKVFAKVMDDQGTESAPAAGTYRNPPIYVLFGPSNGPWTGGEPGLAATINSPGTSIAKVEFWRDTNGNGQLDATDRLLKRDTDGSDGWGVVLGADRPWARGLTKVFARATDSTGRDSEVVGFNYANPHPEAGTLTIDGMPMSVSVGQTVRLTARGVRDVEGRPTGEGVYRYVFYVDTDGDGRVTDADLRLGAGRWGDYGRRWWLDTTVTQAWADAAVDGKVRLLGRALDLTGLWSATPSVMEVEVGG
jgi:hypothetical protein